MPIYAFVDSISASPTILLDLDDQSPLIVVEAPQMSPPPRRTNSSGSSSRNGDVVAQKSYPDRQMPIPLKFAQGSTAEEQSETIQKLARILDGESWLMWQSDGKIEPVFHRVKFGDIEIDDRIADETPDRDLTIQLTAEFASYGLPVTGTATIANDPTAATNPMSFVFPDIQGDVATPLRLAFNEPTPTGLDSQLDISMSSILADSAMNILPNTGTLTLSTVPAGWTVATEANATSVGGSWTKFTRASGATEIIRQIAFPLVEPGDYRLLIRVGAGVPLGASLNVRTGPDAGRTVVLGDVYWRDFGVYRVPRNWPQLEAPSKEALSGTVTTLPDAVFTLTITNPNASDVYWDHAVLTPAGLDSAVAPTYAKVLLNTTTGAADRSYVDGLSQSLYIQTGTTIQPVGQSIGGALPSVIPGLKNFLALIWGTAQAGNAAAQATRVLTLYYLYYPRYLYDRPASS